MRIIILGAGPCGLGAAVALLKLEHLDWQIFERNDRVGGLSSSFVDSQGFTWDVGGHVLFSHYQYFDEAVKAALGDAYYEHFRESWIRILNTWVPYPFQNNIRHLPADALAECINGLRNVRQNDDAKNFHEWMLTKFGSGIVKYFLEPYNRKVWGVPLESMSKDWVGERVSIVDLKRIERNIAESLDDVNWGPNNKFRFPKYGGTGAIFDGIARHFRNRISLNKEVTRINLQLKEVYFADGQKIKYDILINTSPLDRFIRSCVSIPESVRLATDDLEHNSGLIVGLGISGKRVDPKCWMYFPGNNAPFYRATNFFNYSPHNVPDGRTDSYFSIMCETTYSSSKIVDKSLIIDETTQGLINSGMLSENERSHIISYHLNDIPYSYPVPTIRRDAALKIIQRCLESHSVYSRGRFGAWKYEVGNMDHSFMQGVEVVNRILDGQKENIIGIEDGNDRPT